MKLFVILMPVIAFAQPTISSITASAVTDTTARIKWTQSDAANTCGGHIALGTSTGNYTIQTIRRDGQAVAAKGQQVTGLSPSTKYFYVVRQRYAGSCASTSTSAEQTFTTLARAPNRLPLSSAASVPASPTITGTTVSTTCSGTDFQDKVNAQAALAIDNPTLNYAVTITAGTVCTLEDDGLYLPAKTTSNYVVIKSSANASTLPPAGVRTSPNWQANMATIKLRRETPPFGSEPLGGIHTETDSTCISGTCVHPISVKTRGYRFENIIFELAEPAYEQRNVSSTSVSGTTWTVTTSANHTFRYNTWVMVSGLASVEGCDPNGSRAVLSSGITATQFQFTTSCSATGSGGAAGTITYWHSLPVSNIAAGSPGTVTTSSAHGMITGTLVSISGAGGVSGANGHFTTTVTGSTTFTLNSSTVTGTYTSGGVVATDPTISPWMARLEPDSDNIGFDRCIFRAASTSRIGGFPARVTHMIQALGTNSYVVNSYIYSIGAWAPTSSGSPRYGSIFPHESVILYATAGTNHTLDNNYIEHFGIGAMSGGESASHDDVPRDVTITRNYFTAPDSMRHNSPTSNNLWYPARHFIETKASARWTITNNYFMNGWADSGQPSGHLFIFNPRLGGALPNSVNYISDIDMSWNWIDNGSGGIALVAGEQEGFGDTPVTTRIRIANNLITRFNHRTRRTDGPGVGNGGGAFQAWGMDRLTIENNTVYDNRGLIPAFLTLYYQSGTNISIAGNLFTHHKESSFGGLWANPSSDVVPTISTTDANTAFAGFWPGGQFTNSLVIPGLETSDGSCADNSTSGACNFTAAEATTYWGSLALGTIVDGASMAARHDAVWPNRAGSATNPFTYLPAAAYRGYGVSIPELSRKLGRVTNVRVAPLRLSAIVRYTAPDSSGCTVEYGTSATYGTGERLTDNTASRSRVVTLPDLTASTTYNVRILCQTEQPTFSFTTGG